VQRQELLFERDPIAGGDAQLGQAVLQAARLVRRIFMT
jgi:hypothetical protein